MTANEKAYRYRECGLDNVYLQNGFEIVGNKVSIKNIEDLHDAIGRFLVEHKKDLTGKELRFLRHEMLMSQATLAYFLGVGWQSVNRWENGRTRFPKAAEALMRLLYREHRNEGSGIKKSLKTIADLEDQLSRKLTMSKTPKGWQPLAA